MSNKDAPGSTSSGKDYEVGYGRPPKVAQFKPGQSGNPKGRKRRHKSVAQQMQDELNRRVTITEGGQAKRYSVQQVMLRSIATKAAKGDLRAATFVMNLVASESAAHSETIDQTTLTAEDQRLFEQMMSELTSSSAPECEGSDSPRNEAPPSEPLEKEKADENEV